MNQAHSSYAINDEKKTNSYYEARNGGKNNRESFLFWGGGGVIFVGSQNFPRSLGHNFGCNVIGTILINIKRKLVHTFVGM